MPIRFVLGIESSKQRGMGHFFHSMSYIEWITRMGHEYIYLINNDSATLDWLESKEIKYTVVDYSDKKSGWEKKIIEENKIDVWINDKFITELSMAKNIKDSGTYLAIIDDIGDGEQLADIHFVGNLLFTKNDFKCKNLYKGIEYIVMNPNIKQCARQRNDINKILVFMGGSDPYDVTPSVVKELINTEYEFDVLLGPNAKCRDKIEGVEGDRFNIFENVSSVIDVFREYDFAISGGGITPFELSACGIPNMIIANAPHEVNTGKYLDKLGVSIFAGDCFNWNKSLLKKLDEINIGEMSNKGLQYFDGMALDRILGEIVDRVIVRKKNDII